MRHLRLITAFFFVFITVACTNNSELDSAQINQRSAENTELIIWWEKGFNFEEDEALSAVVSHWEQNPAYSRVLKENVWGKALKIIVVDGISPEKAADEAIERIKEIFDQWK